MRTVLWTGSRGWEDVDQIVYTVEGLKRPFRSIVGDADGFDALVWEVLAEFKLPRLKFKAKWKLHGRGAGPKRNELMIAWLTIMDLSGFVIAGWDGSSPGTKDCVKQARRAEFDVWDIGESTRDIK